MASAPRLDPELTGSGWRDLPADSMDFCCRLADVAALQYSRHLQQFASENGRSPTGGDGSSSSCTDFPALCDLFCSALHQRLGGESNDDTTIPDQRQTPSRPATACGHVNRVRTLQPVRRISRSTSPPAERDGGAKIRRSISKRMPSFLRGTKRTASAGRKRKALKKEGVLHQLVDVEGGEIQWAKCRVVVKRDNSGHVISFFSPPKATKPRSGVLCFLINEVRPTTTMELPDCKHSFVIKGINGMEYVLDCSSQEEMISWVDTIQECSRFDTGNRQHGAAIMENTEGEADYDEAENTLAPTASLRRHSIASPARVSCHSGSRSSTGSRHSSCSNSGSSLGPRGSAARLSTASLPAVRTSSLSAAPVPMPPPTLLSQAVQEADRDDHMGCQPSCDSLASDGFLRSPDEAPRYVDAEHRAHRTSSGGSTTTSGAIEAQPWFHGPLSRQQAAALVCHGGVQSHGTFLVRESESREGTMVLTFNCDGKAKHLRMTVQADRSVKVQQWLFDNIFHAIDYFKMHPVPLENSTDREVCLLSYVVATGSHRTSSILEESSDPTQEFLAPLPEQQIVSLPPDDFCKATADTYLPRSSDHTPGPSSMTSTPIKPSPSAIGSPNEQSPHVPCFDSAVVDLPPEKGAKPFRSPGGKGPLRGAPEAGRPRTYFIDGTGFHARNSYVVAN